MVNLLKFRTLFSFWFQMSFWSQMKFWLMKANKEDPDQTVLQKQSDMGLYLLLKPF